MRRLPALLLVAAIAGTLLSLGTAAALFASRGACPAAEGRAVHLLARLVTAPAVAQQRMRFTPVPAESLERERSQRRSGATAPAAPDVPADPAAPVPAVPEPSEVDAPGADKSGDVVRFGSDIHIHAGHTVRGDVVAMGGDVRVDGHVYGDVVAMGGDVRLGPDAEVEGQVVTFGGQLHEEPGSRVGGQRVTAGGFSRRWMAWPVLGAVNSTIKVAVEISKMLVLLLIVWGLTQLAPNRTRTALGSLKSEPVMSFGIGLLACALFIPSVVALALVVAILCITIIGIPLALAVILGYVLAIVLLVVWGYIVGAAALGERLSLQLGRPARTLTLMAVWGVAALTAVKVLGHLFGIVPMGGGPGGMLKFLAAVVSGVVMIMGAGALLRTQLRRENLSQWWPPGRRAATPAPAPAPAAPAAPGAVSAPWPAASPPGPPSAPAPPPPSGV